MRAVPVSVCLVVVLVLVGAVVCLNPVHAITFQQEATVTVNIGVNYGIGAVEWHNGTIVPLGEFLLNATMRVATVEFMNFPGFPGPGLPGAFVTGINGVSQNPSANLYWTYWVYDPLTQQYEMTPVGAGSYALIFDQTIQWYYQNAGSMTNPPLQPYTSVSLNVRLDSSTDPPTAILTGSIYPVPTGPINVTLEYSNNQGANYQEISRIVSGADGTFSYSWRLPGGGMFMFRADAQGVKSSPASIGTGGGVPGFLIESILIGSMLGLLFGFLRRRPRSRS